MVRRSLTLYCVFINTLKSDLTDKMTRFQQKGIYSNVFRPVYNGLFVLRTRALKFYPGDFISDKNSSSNPNVIYVCMHVYMYVYKLQNSINTERNY